MMNAVKKKKPLAEEAQIAIRNMILKGELRPGTKINIDEMTRQLDYSKTPIREALKILISEDLVTYSPHVGYSVKEVNIQEYLQMYEMQEILETYLLRRIAVMNYLVDFESLESINRELAEMIERKEWGKLGEQNDKFHTAFYKNYPNPMLLEAVHEIWNKVRIQRNLIFQSKLFIATVIADHQEMMLAVRNEDQGAAERIARKHYARGLESILTFFPVS